MYANMRVISIEALWDVIWVHSDISPTLINLLTHSAEKIDIQKAVYSLIQNLTKNSIKMPDPKFQVMVKKNQKKMMCA